MPPGCQLKTEVDYESAGDLQGKSLFAFFLESFRHLALGAVLKNGVRKK